MQRVYSTAWRLVQERGEQFRQWEEAEQRAHLEEISERRGPGKGKRMGAAMDGGMIHIRREGWKEVKVGTVFELARRQVVVEKQGERVEVGRAVQQSYVAHLGGPEEFGEHV